MSILHNFCTGFIILCIVSQVNSSNVNYSFSKFTVENGLAHSSVASIVEDKVGSYWVGTPNGLTRILGSEVVNYAHVNNDTTTILSDKIIFVTKDNCDRIWVGTNLGISKYISTSDSFEPLKYDNKIIEAYSFQIYHDTLLLGGTGRIWKYSCKEDKIIQIIKSTDECIMDYHYVYCYDKDRYLVINYYKGIYWLDAITGQLSRFADINPGFECSRVYVDSSRHLWVAPYKNGLNCYSLEGGGKLLKHYTTANSALSEDAVTDIIEHNGKLWIATDGGGINILDINTSSFSYLLHSDDDFSSISSNSIKVLYEDSYDNIWGGTVKNGLICIRKSIMKYFTSAINGYGWNNNKTVSAICEDEENNVWLGVEHNGISHYHPEENIFYHYSFNNCKSVMSIIEYDASRLLVAIYGDGVYWFNRKTGELTRFIVVDLEKDKYFGESSIGMRLFRSGDGTIYFCGISNYKYNPVDHSFKEMKYDYINHLNLLDFVANDVFHTIAYDNQGVYEILNDDFSIRRIYEDTKNEIKAVAAYREQLYICDEQGLKSFNYVSKQEEKIDIPFNMKVNALICDDKGRLWIAANEAVLCYYGNEKRMVTLSESDGFRPTCFFQNAILKSHSGAIYLSGSDGLLQIDTKNLSDEMSESPEPFLMSVYQTGKIVIGELKNDFQKLSLPWNYSSVSLRITIKEQDFLRKKHVRYIIYNDQYNSVIENTSNWLYLPTLYPGSYFIGVSCYSKDGKWTEPKRLLQLTVLPPWWESWWFYMLFVIMVLCLITAFTIYIINSKKRKLQETLNIEKSRSAEEKVDFLINMSHELRTPLTLIYAPLKRLCESQDNKILREQLLKILIQVKNMTQLINIILDVRKMEMGATFLQIGTYGLNEWVRSIAENFREELNIKHIGLEYELSEEIGVVNFDKEKCRIVLSNFLMNALKYSYSGGMVIVKTTMEYPAKIVRLSVVDQGVGLEDADRSRLFSQFYQGKHSVKGSGIGLFYSKLLVEMQNGSIGFSDDRTTGTTFYFELPTNLECGQARCEKGEYMGELIDTTTNITLNSFPDFVFSKYSILLVDDALDFLDYLKDFFKDYFRKVYIAADGNDALTIIKKEHPDIVISDVVMSEIDGFKLCRMIKTDLEISHIPVILLTALQESQSLSIGYKMGADAYVSKPFDTSFLLTIIKNQLYAREVIKKHIQEVNIVEISRECTFSNADELFLAKLNEFIKQQIDNQDLNLNRINRHMCMSHSSLYTKIKALTGYSVNDYVNQIRINQAKEYLISTDKKITEIANLVGFGDSRYFSTVFKKLSGMSPTQYKESYQFNS